MILITIPISTYCFQLKILEPCFSTQLIDQLSESSKDAGTLLFQLWAVYEKLLFSLVTAEPTAEEASEPNTKMVTYSHGRAIACQISLLRVHKLLFV